MTDEIAERARIVAPLKARRIAPLIIRDSNTPTMSSKHDAPTTPWETSTSNTELCEADIFFFAIYEYGLLSREYGKILVKPIPVARLSFEIESASFQMSNLPLDWSDFESVLPIAGCWYFLLFTSEIAPSFAKSSE